MKIQEFNNFDLDLTLSLLWQYNEATNLQSLITQKQSWYDLYFSEFWRNWFFNVFSLNTADLFGTAVWSIILNVPFFVPVQLRPLDAPTWGFNQVISPPPPPHLLNSYLNYENSNFSDIEGFTLTVEEQRWLLRLRYFQLTTLTNIADFNGDPAYSINDFLAYLCTDNQIGYNGTIYVLDNLDMTMTYHFTDPDFPVALFTIINTLGTWPRPAGVSISFTGLT